MLGQCILYDAVSRGMNNKLQIFTAKDGNNGTFESVVIEDCVPTMLQRLKVAVT